MAKPSITNPEWDTTYSITGGPTYASRVFGITLHEGTGTPADLDASTVSINGATWATSTNGDDAILIDADTEALQITTPVALPVSEGTIIIWMDALTHGGGSVGFLYEDTDSTWLYREGSSSAFHEAGNTNVTFTGQDDVFEPAPGQQRVIITWNSSNRQVYQGTTQLSTSTTGPGATAAGADIYISNNSGLSQAMRNNEVQAVACFSVYTTSTGVTNFDADEWGWFREAGGAANPKGPLGHPLHGPFAGPIGP